MLIIIPNERPMSLNKFYSGKHWSVRADEAQRVHDLVVAHLPRKYEMYKEKVDIFIMAYFKNRPFDSDNIISKLYIDGLKGRVIEDDKHSLVGFVASRSEVDAKNPRLEILIVKSLIGLFHTDHNPLLK